MDIQRCLGPIHGLLTTLLEQSIAPIDVLRIHCSLKERGVSCAIRKGLAQNKVRIKAIQFWSTDLTGTIMRDISEGISFNDSLEAVGFCHCHFKPDAADELARGLQKSSNIQQLSLCSSLINDNDAAAIVHSGGSLAHINLGSINCGSRTMQALASPCKAKNAFLQSLNLSHQGILSCLDISPLAKGLIENTSLRWLNLTGIHLNEAVVENVIQCLRRNRTLQILV